MTASPAKSMGSRGGVTGGGGSSVGAGGGVGRGTAAGITATGPLQTGGRAAVATSGRGAGAPALAPLRGYGPPGALLGTVRNTEELREQGAADAVVGDLEYALVRLGCTAYGLHGRFAS